MGVVFIVLIALAITSSTMSWLDASETVRNAARKFSRNKIESPETPDPKEPPQEAAAPAPQDRPGPSGEVVAAITVALAMARRTGLTRLPAIAATATGPSAWAAARRRRAMERASKVIR